MAEFPGPEGRAARFRRCARADGRARLPARAEGGSPGAPGREGVGRAFAAAPGRRCAPVAAFDLTPEGA